MNGSTEHMSNESKPTRQTPPSEPHAQDGESGIAIAGQALKFLGIMLIAGGSLAMLRTRGVDDGRFFGGSPWLFLLLIPLGMAAYAGGFYLCGRDAGERHDG